jgi:excisionase family DNA binding protein
MNPIAYTVDQAAETLHVHPGTIRRMLRAHSLRGVRFGRLWRIPREEILRVCGVSVQTETASVTALAERQSKEETANETAIT